MPPACWWRTAAWRRSSCGGCWTARRSSARPATTSPASRAPCRPSRTCPRRPRPVSQCCRTDASRVLVAHSGMEAELMWGLLDRAALFSEAGYYLTSFSCAVQALENLPALTPPSVAVLPD
ncbi:uncharacterized protein LOC134535306 [Bacillus rossius redtenbacheri]|uniref:uncharacterized protein LOC134535306 n=1 Tax=Bacillus rossius redtenbacheri TaxID=93214 RepID=UPI002FDE6CDE